MCSKIKALTFPTLDFTLRLPPFNLSTTLVVFAICTLITEVFNQHQSIKVNDHLHLQHCSSFGG